MDTKQMKSNASKTIESHMISLQKFNERYQEAQEELSSTTALLLIYKQMYLMRSIDKKLSSLYSSGLVRGFCHLSIGQESIYGALWWHFHSEKYNSSTTMDKVLASYRCHSIAFATGSTIAEIIGECLGKRVGCSEGKGGLMHLHNSILYGGHGIVAAQAPLGIGVAFAIKYSCISKPSENWLEVPVPRVCFVFYGDGASNQGQLYESFNLALIFKLPVVFICENNGYGMSTPVSAACPDDNFYKRAYGIPGIRCDDSDVIRLLALFRFAKEHASQNGPIILQIDTTRICGHSTLDTAQSYRGDTDSLPDRLEEFRQMLAEKIGSVELLREEEETTKAFEQESSMR